MKKTRIATVLFTLVVGFAACGGRTEETDSPCTDVADKLRSCNLLTEGEFECNDILGDHAECTSSCLLTTECRALAWAICNYSGEGDEELIQCLADCEAPVEFACDDGETLPPGFRCDGEPDCQDGSDEQGCAISTFRCDSGETVPSTAHCDAQRDCSDGSDEEGCARLLCDPDAPT